MKIGLVLASPPGYSETFFRNKIKGLQQSGIDVVLFVNTMVDKTVQLPCRTIVAPSFNADKPLYSVCNLLIQLSKAVILNPLKSFKLCKLEKKQGRSLMQSLRSVLINQFLLTENLDWIHFGFGTIAIGRELVASVIGAKMAVSFRGYDVYVYPVKFPGCYKLLFTKVDAVHVLSEAMSGSLVKYGYANQAAIQKITPAIDTSFFNQAQLAAGNRSVVRLLTVARLHWIKGLDYVLIALEKLKGAGIKFHYTIIGDGDEYEKLVFITHQLGIADCVTFAGSLSQETIKEHFESTDIYLQYSHQEGFCNAVLEAQAMGLMCIVSDADGLVENVVNEVTGWVVPKRNPQALADKIKFVRSLSDVEKQQIQLQAKWRVSRNFNIEKQKDEFFSFFQRLS